ncbi:MULTISPECIES: hypothetical protein [Microbacterium]|uniref:hypothetical protein n=1 Tax=Microbacterium TaxID=33882 RepID=UPI003010604C
MIIVLILLALGVWGIVATTVELRRTRVRRMPTDWSRVPVDLRSSRGGIVRRTP